MTRAKGLAHTSLGQSPRNRCQRLADSTAQTNCNVDMVRDAANPISFAIVVTTYCGKVGVHARGYGSIPDSKPPALSAVADSIAELQGGETAVNAVIHGLQFLVGAGFHDAPARDHDDSINVPHGGEPMGDDE